MVAADDQHDDQENHLARLSSDQMSPEFHALVTVTRRRKETGTIYGRDWTLLEISGMGKNG